MDTSFNGQVYHNTGGIGNALEIMDKICFIAETGPERKPFDDAHVDAENFGRFQVYHVPNDGNCLFTAIGHFVGANQAAVRDHIITKTGQRPGVWGGEDEAKLAAMAYERKVFIIHRYLDAPSAYVPDVKSTQGFDTNGTPIDMEHLDRPITSGKGPKMTLYVFL
ncbi:MAG: hypothetical protein LBK24_00435 [Puniceicoccales bacterium]|jgi:hypothetical protein|nr:hypothetical protein [Puniceicoccales bacterium]